MIAQVVIAAYQAGVRMVDIRAQTNIRHDKQIHRILDHFGIPRRGPIPRQCLCRPKAEQDAIMADYMDGMMLVDICARYSTSVKTIHAIRRERGIPARSRRNRVPRDRCQSCGIPLASEPSSDPTRCATCAGEATDCAVCPDGHRDLLVAILWHGVNLVRDVRTEEPETVRADLLSEWCTGLALWLDVPSETWRAFVDGLEPGEGEMDVSEMVEAQHRLACAMLAVASWCPDEEVKADGARLNRNESV